MSAGYYKISGKNGASFFFNVSCRKDWSTGLEFYRAVSCSAHLKKVILRLLYPVFKCKACSLDVAQIIQCELNLPCAPEIPEHSSAMISPTRDKAVIHHHGRGYEKIASGKSWEGVRREMEVYKLLNSCELHHFCCSSLREAESTEQYVRFFMNYAEGNFAETVPALDSLLPALAEFFSCTPAKISSWQSLRESLMPEIDTLDLDMDWGGETPVGLVHRDFKPWNVKQGDKPLFFDFESAAFDGCPLEDLFNYAIDPILMNDSVNQAARQTPHLFAWGKSLLQMLGIAETEILRYWKWYLAERIVFWRRQEKFEFAMKFQELWKLTV